LDAGADGEASFEEFGMKGRQYTWAGGESLPELLERKVEIMENHKQALIKAELRKGDRPVWEILGQALDDDEDSEQCSVCAI
jgi:hypothetical protein